MSADRDLLFGVLALQNGLIDQGQLVAAFQAWTLDKSKSLADHLLQGGDLDADQRSAVEAMVALHLKKHGGDAEKSLASLTVGRSTREKLAILADPQLDATLQRLGSGSTEPEADRTASYDVGSATSDGQRFRVLRPHARGGLGAVFVALDGELNREVALKQILDTHADDHVSRQRFLLEAEITGGLEHPGIVPVYGLGAYQDGRPYYAMRFIRGDSLKDAIAAFHRRVGTAHRPTSIEPAVGDAHPTETRMRRKDPLALRKLLRRFLDVCNALEYAHARGVLHRDIKPGNIIIGKYGETLVVDWGLAKATGQAEPSVEERPLAPFSASGSAETLPGSAIGTPAYMPPEQARGDLDALGPRSDVYSLGATLYAILTGQAPFEGDDLGDVLRQVQRGAFPPPRQLDPSIDPPLEAICLKAMALKPDDRYPFCRALADDLERWLADERVEAYREPWTRTLNRWLTRHRTAVTGAAAAGIMALIGLAAVAAVQTQGRTALAEKNTQLEQANTKLTEANTALDAQRQRAEAREQQAIDAVKRFRDAVANNPALKNSPELEELRKTLLQEPLAFFKTLRDQLQAGADASPESLDRLGWALFDLAELTSDIGDKRDAVVAYKESLAIYERLVRNDPAKRGYQHRFASCYNSLGGVLEDTGQVDEAIRSYHLALTIVERLAEDGPEVTDEWRNVAGCHINLGGILSRTGRHAEALESLGRGLVILERLAREDPAWTEVARALALGHNRTGSVQRDLGRHAEALESHGRARAILERLVHDDPEDLALAGELAMIRNNIGITRLVTGPAELALQSFEEARAVLERLVRERSSTIEFAMGLASSHQGIAEIKVGTGRLGDAIESYGRAREILDRLAREHPTVTGYASSLARVHGSLGNLQQATGQDLEAMRSYGRAMAILERLAGENPTVTEYPSLLALLHNNMGLLQVKTGQIDGALRSYDRAQALQERLARENPGVVAYAVDVARTLTNLGILHGRTGNLLAALSFLRKSVSIQERLARDQPGIAEISIGLASSLANLGNVHSAMGQREAALRSYRKGLEIRERLAREEPESVVRAGHVADSYYYIGMELFHGGQAEAAIESYGRAMEIREGLVRRNPTLTEYQNDLASSHLAIGVVRDKTGQTDAALDSYQRAQGIQEQMVSENPTVSEFAENLAKTCQNIGFILAKRGRAEEASRSFGASLEIRRRLARERPSVPEFASEAGRALHALSAIDAAAGRLAQARERLREAIDWQKKALAIDGQNPTYSQLLSSHFTSLRELARRLGDTGLAAEAERALAELRGGPSGGKLPEELFAP